MHQLSKYDTYIFDCDGVILDSNKLKVDAMSNAVETYTSDNILIRECTEYFRNNFGKSRFHHVDVFVNEILKVELSLSDAITNQILEAYSSQCKELYMSAEVTTGFVDFITALEGNKYVASGSEQNELREVFHDRGLDLYFDGIYGSPEKKTNHVKVLLTKSNCKKAIMFGDAISDLEAAKDNNIDFVFYSPLSNVKEKMMSLCKKNEYSVIDSFEGILYK